METVVVDCHKEVLPHWFKEYLRLELPLVEVRIDQHHDMNHECPALPAREGRQIQEYFSKIMPYIIEYTKTEINEANFTCPAFHYGIIGAVYHFNPRGEEIEAYGRVCGSEFIDTPKTKRETVSIGGKIRNRIRWDEALTKLSILGGKSIPVSEKITMEEFRRDIEESSFPVVISFDLDGKCGIGERNPTKEVLEKRLGRVEHVLECVSSPAFACIARSQTPRRYVPSEMVDGLQEAATNLIQTIYT